MSRIAGFAELRWRKKQMKPKKMIALAALIFALCGYGTSAAASEQDSWDNDFRMDWIADEGSFEVYQDRETGLDPGEYAEYLVGKAAECTDRLRHIWG